MTVIFLILRCIYILDDSIGLKKELKVIAYFWMIYGFLSVCTRIIYPITLALHSDTEKYEAIILQFAELLGRFCWFGINYMSTYWVVHKFGSLLRQQSSIQCVEATAISLSTRKMRHAAHESTLCLMDDADDDETDDRVEMKRILQKHTIFDAFMRHLVKEYCLEIEAVEDHQEFSLDSGTMSEISHCVWRSS